MRTRSSRRSASARAAAAAILRCQSRPSAIWSPMRITGLRAVIGSWKIMPMRAPRIWQSSLSGRARRSRPSSRMRPAARMPPGSRPMMASASRDLPDPDSPTMPSVPPSSRRKLISAINGEGRLAFEMHRDPLQLQAHRRPSRRGSKRSRKPSPRRLKPSTARAIATPGATASQGAVSRKVWASFSIRPQLGVGGGRPRPR